MWRVLHTLEDALLVLALAGVLVFPLLELVYRRVFASTLIGGNAMTQHCTLLVSIFGAMLAARTNRLLTISPGFASARAPWGAGFEIIRAGVATAITALLAYSAWVFYTNERGTGRNVAFNIPVEVPLVLIGIGFAVIAVRLLRHAGGWRERTGAAIVAAAITALVLGQLPDGSAAQSWVLLAVLLVAVVLGAPVFTLLGGAAIFLLWGDGQYLGAVADEFYKLSTNALIPSLPLFTLAGYFLAEGGTSRRMVRLLRALVGDMRAGPAIVTVVSCAFFTSLTGASGVTILALGGLLVPFLIEARYTERASIGMLTGVGSIGLLFAPCLPLILYAIVARVEIKAMFLAGILPGLLLLAASAAWGAWARPPAPAGATPWKFNPRELGWAALIALPELLIPVVSLGAIFSGLATPVEAAAITALYALVIELFIYRELKPAALLHAVRECGLLIGGVLLILGVAQALTGYLIFDQVPERLVELVTAHITSPLAFIALLNVVLLVVGCLMDVFSAIIVVVPLITALSAQYGLNPVHFGVLFLANLGLGFLTPPVGMNLFLSSLRFKKPMGEVLRGALPYFWIQLGVVLVISYWPKLSLLLPGWFGFESAAAP